jgi:hypothetical protein
MTAAPEPSDQCRKGLRRDERDTTTIAAWVRRSGYPPGAETARTIRVTAWHISSRDRPCPSGLPWAQETPPLVVPMARAPARSMAQGLRASHALGRISRVPRGEELRYRVAAVARDNNRSQPLAHIITQLAHDPPCLSDLGFAEISCQGRSHHP